MLLQEEVSKACCTAGVTVTGEFYAQFVKFLVLIYRLQVISTKVGGVPEVLPQDMIRLVEPNVPGWSLVEGYIILNTRCVCQFII